MLHINGHIVVWSDREAELTIHLTLTKSKLPSSTQTDSGGSHPRQRIKGAHAIRSRYFSCLHGQRG